MANICACDHIHTLAQRKTCVANPIYAKLIKYVWIDKKNFIIKNNYNIINFYYYKSKYNSSICACQECAHCRNFTKKLTEEELTKLYKSNYLLDYPRKSPNKILRRTNYLHTSRLAFGINPYLEISMIYYISSYHLRYNYDTFYRRSYNMVFSVDYTHKELNECGKKMILNRGVCVHDRLDAAFEIPTKPGNTYYCYYN